MNLATSQIAGLMPSHSPLNRAPQIVQNTSQRSFKLNKLEGLTDHNCEFVQPMPLHKILVKRTKCISSYSKPTILTTTFPLENEKYEKVETENLFNQSFTSICTYLLNCLSVL